MSGDYSFSLTTFSPSGKLVCLLHLWFNKDTFASASLTTCIADFRCSCRTLGPNRTCLECCESRCNKHRYQRWAFVSHYSWLCSSAVLVIFSYWPRSFTFLLFSPYRPRFLYHSQSYLSTSINLATNGVVIATEKKSASTLIDDSSIEKVAMVCDSIGMVYSGMGPDFRLLVSRARKYAQQYKQLYMENPPTRILVEQLARVMQDYTHRG